MEIRKAKSSDKSHILKFCQNTFSWGDYIKDVWDYWLSEGELLVIEKTIPIGCCHALFSNKQVWIEGIRINSRFRRQCLASNLINKVESLALEKQIPISLMLIDIENFASLSMAKNLGYVINQTWKFYSLEPRKNSSHEISYDDLIQSDELSHYVKSWRWIPLTKKQTSSLNSKHCIVHSKKGENHAIAILADSGHFQKTLIVTLFAGSKSNTLNIISYLQNLGFEKKYKRLQILTKETLPEFKNLEKKISFHLMQKLLS